MTIRTRRGRSLPLLLVLLILPLATHAQPPLNGRELVDALRRGGHTIYFRHEATDWSQTDRIREAGDWLSCDGALVRQLSDEGRRRAAQTGEAMRRLGIPVGEVLASPYCRAMETARLLGVGEVRASTDVMNLRAAEYVGGREAVIAAARRLLASPPPPGTNRVVVAHGNVAQAATPVYPGEGEAAVFAPDGAGGFTFVARIPPQAWSRLDRPE